MMTEAQLYTAIEQLIRSNMELAESNRVLAKEEHEKVAILYKLVVTGDTDKGQPGMLEVQRDHTEFINTFKTVTSKGAWILIGILISGAVVFTWQAIQHVALGLQ